MRMRRPTFLFMAVLTGALTSCSSNPQEPPSHKVHGNIVEIAGDRTAITVDHDEIPGVMPAMTMPFPLASPELADGLAPGNEVELTLETGDAWRVTRVLVLAQGAPPPTPDTRAHVDQPPREVGEGEGYFQVGVGQPVPEFRLIAQNGEALALSDFAGKATVLTFIYTRCPMPDFCPLVTHKMVELQKALGTELRERTQLLLVTIDPKFDTPEVLERFGRQSGLDLGQASLLTGPIREVALLSSYFGLEFWDQKDGSINHKLRLVVIDSRGRLHAELHGTSWTTETVIGLIRQVFAESDAMPRAG